MLSAFMGIGLNKSRIYSFSALLPENTALYNSLLVTKGISPLFMGAYQAVKIKRCTGWGSELYRIALRSTIYQDFTQPRKRR